MWTVEYVDRYSQRLDTAMLKAKYIYYFTFTSLSSPFLLADCDGPCLASAGVYKDHGQPSTLGGEIHPLHDVGGEGGQLVLHQPTGYTHPPLKPAHHRVGQNTSKFIKSSKSPIFRFYGSQQ